MKNIKKMFYILIGIFLIVLGIIGVLLPIIPGIPFFIMGFMFFAKASNKFLRWMLKNKYIALIMKKFKKKGINESIRNYTLASIWITHIFGIFYIKILSIKILLFLMILIFTWILLSIKTYKKIKNI